MQAKPSRELPREARTREASAIRPARRSDRLEDRLELAQLPADAAADLIAQLEHAGVADRVQAWFPSLVRLTIPAAWRIPRCLETFCCEAPSASLELADRGITLAQPVQQLDPHRLAEHAEALGHELDQRLRERVGNGLCLAIRQSTTTVQLWS